MTSGTSVKGKKRISKTGNKMLRKTLFFPAMVVMRINSPLKQFVDKLIKNNHGSVLEHGTVYLLFTKEQEQLFTKYTFNPYSKIFFDTDNKVYVTTNYRVLIENNWLLDMRFACQTPDIYHPKRKTVKIICSRSISHALVRHRTFSFTQESTRQMAA